MESDDQLFVSSVLEHFGRLRDDGFAVTDVRPSGVVFSKPGRRVVVSRETRTGQIEVMLGFRASPFSFYEFMHFCKGDREYRNETAPDRDRIAAAVEATANRVFGQPDALTTHAIPQETAQTNGYSAQA